MPDPKFDHAREFTNHEILTLRVWFDLDSAGLDDLAEKFLDAGLMLEHYTSLLDNDPSKRSNEEVQQQQTLSFELQRILNQAEVALMGKATVRPSSMVSRVFGTGRIDELGK